MIELTKKKQEALLLIYKDVAGFYNASSLSKELGITQVGTMKILKKLEKAGVLLSKKIGKSIVYKINISEEFVQKLIAFALINEASKFQRWKDEFKALHKKGRVLLFYGSASRNYSQAKDIDIFIVLNKDEEAEVNREIEKIQNVLPKKIHTIKATVEDLERNLKESNQSMIEIIKTAVVLYGYDEYMEIINGFAIF
ncbi:winged helix-turn-helix transcriptional regulator [Candidatus Pacearchaeota archaeon]|nr:winged helix-turn-helix transcriptional regulator [Candidatus Pacearchaeota archaeon]